MQYTKEQLLELHDKLCAEAKALMVTKNADYSGGSGDPFSNFRGSAHLGIHPIKGIMMRMMDKFKRIESFIDKGELLVKDEPVQDIPRDLINYCVLMAGMIDELKLNEKETNGIGTIFNTDEQRDIAERTER